MSFVCIPAPNTTTDLKSMPSQMNKHEPQRWFQSFSCGSLKDALCMENQKVFTDTCLFDFLVVLRVDVNPLTIQGRKLRPERDMRVLENVPWNVQWQRVGVQGYLILRSALLITPLLSHHTPQASSIAGLSASLQSCNLGTQSVHAALW